MLMLNLTKLLILSLLVSTPAMAGTKDGGGGDDLGIEFVRSVSEAVAEIQAISPELLSEVSVEEIQKLAAQANVIVVDTELEVRVGNAVQNSTAVNMPSTLTVKICRPRWKGISDRRIRNGISLHEVLSLMGKERTGHYPISGRYVALNGGNEEMLRASLADATPVRNVDYERNMPIYLDVQRYECTASNGMVLRYDAEKTGSRVEAEMGGFKRIYLSTSDIYNRQARKSFITLTGHGGGIGPDASPWENDFSMEFAGKLPENKTVTVAGKIWQRPAFGKWFKFATVRCTIASGETVSN